VIDYPVRLVPASPVFKTVLEVAINTSFVVVSRSIVELEFEYLVLVLCHNLDFRVDRREFISGIIDLHLPINTPLRTIHIACPSCRRLTQGFNVTKAFISTH